jgi:hypothetical protein
VLVLLQQELVVVQTLALPLLLVLQGLQGQQALALLLLLLVLVEVEVRKSLRVSPQCAAGAASCCRYHRVGWWAWSWC